MGEQKVESREESREKRVERRKGRDEIGRADSGMERREWIEVSKECRKKMECGEKGLESAE